MLTTILRPTTIALRDRERLQLIHPPMALLAAEILAAMERLGYPMTVTAGLRTADEQFVLFQKGRRRVEGREPDAIEVPGQGFWVPNDRATRRGIVTNADGFGKRSNHQAKADGRGRAVDCVFLIDGPDLDTDLDDPSWDDRHPWPVYGTLAEHLGGAKLRWLGRGPTLKDMPHIEWVAD